MDVFAQFLDERDDRKRLTPSRAAHRETIAPDQCIADLMSTLRAVFYGAGGEKKFFQDQKALMIVLTWPATWLNDRRIGLPVDRYDAILREIIKGVAEHADRAAIKHVPAYLERCVRLWFVHNGEELYEERKRVRNALDLRFLKGMPAQAPAGPDPVESMAQVHRVLATQRRGPKTRKSDDSQPSLFDV